MTVIRFLKRILPLSLNFELKNFLDYFRQEEINDKGKKAKVYFCDAATYNNLGDQAIALAMERFIKDLVGEDCFFEIGQDQLLRKWKSLRNAITEDDVICLSGGGNMGDLYPRFEAIRRKILKNYPNNRIIIFPQTIDYSKDNYGQKELLRSVDIYNKHQNILLCAREQKSYSIMREYYQNVCLVPDIVFYLYGKLDLKKCKKKNEIGLCFRNDKESIVSDETKQMMFQKFLNAGYNIVELDTMVPQSIQINDEKSRRLQVVSKITEFQECDCIITDRLHGMIFSILADTPCIVVDNSNHKVFGVLETIADCISGAAKLENFDKVIDVVEGIRADGVIFDNSRIDYQAIKDFVLGDA